MPLETLVAGRYSSTFSSVDTGITQNGYEIQQDTAAELVNQTDAFGDSIIDFVWRGGSVYVMYESKAFKAGSVAAFYPWGTLGVMATAAAPIGRLASNVAAALVLTSTANTPAAAAPATATFSLSILAPNSNLRLLFTSKVRNVPTRLLVLPADAGAGTFRWFATT